MQKKLVGKILIFMVGIGILSVVVAGWWHGSASLLASNTPQIVIGIGRLLGLLGMCAILTQLILIGRIRFIEELWGHDRMNRIHRIVGYSILGLFVGHGVLLGWGYSLLGNKNFIDQNIDFIQNWPDVLNALLGILLFAIIITLSVPGIRRRLRYETWYFAHLFMYLAISMVFDHQTNAGDFVGNPQFTVFWQTLVYTIVGFLIIYRFVRPLYLLVIHRFHIEKVVPENDTVNSLYITGERMNTFKWKPGQFAHIRIFAKGFWTESHPFSISVAPNGTYMRFTPKAIGDFTKKVSQVPQGSLVLIDGPLGHFTEDAAKTDDFVFIAGGIGITPIRAMLQALAHESKKMTLIWAVTHEEDLVFMNELPHLTKNIHIFVSKGAHTPEYQEGRLNTEVIQELVPDIKMKDVYLCGPLLMMEMVRKSLYELNVPNTQIHFEKFSY